MSFSRERLKRELGLAGSMGDHILLFNIDILGKSPPGSQFLLDNVMYILKSITKFWKIPIRFISHISSKMSIF